MLDVLALLGMTVIAGLLVLYGPCLANVCQFVQ
jgi:hypothetical protein